MLSEAQHHLYAEAISNYLTPLFEPERLRIFLSYSHEDSEFVGDLKRGLDTLHVDSFLAHEDIQPSNEWEDVIIAKLKSTEILVCILTEAFYRSEWTQQEVGMAVGNDKTVISVSVDNVAPIGFTKRYQALKFKRNSWVSMKEKENQNSSPYFEVFKVICSQANWHDRARQCLIRGLASSHSFYCANKNAQLLSLFSHYTEVEINELVRGSITNDNILLSYHAKPIVRDFYKSRVRNVKPKYRRIFEGLYDVK